MLLLLLFLLLLSFQLTFLFRELLPMLLFESLYPLGLLLVLLFELYADRALRHRIRRLF